MTRHQDPSASYYEQRRAKHSGDEGKRRKMIRWLKKAIGVNDEPVETPHYQVPPTPSCPSLSLSHSSLSSIYETAKDHQLGHSTNGSEFEHHTDIPVYPTHCQKQFTSSFRSTRDSVCSATSTTSLSEPSIYEYHHQMPRRRHQPKIDRHSNAPHVLIIGGGIGGLCLAQGLKKSGIRFTIFERDPTPNYRTQGYRLRINSAGYEALKANLSRENFEVFLRSAGNFLPGFMYVDAETGGAAPASVKLAHTASATHHLFSTDRAMLRSLLLMDLLEGTEIQYDMAFQKYEILSNGRVEVLFENGKCVEGSVLVGADGPTSRVRRQYLPRHVTLLDTDSGAIYGKTPITADIEQYFATASTTMVTSEHPKMALVIEPRGATVIDDDIDDTANADVLDDQNYLCWVLFARANAFHVYENMTVHDLYAMSPEEVAEVSMQMTSSWCPRIRALLEKQDPEWASFLRISTMSPEINAWRPTVVTMLGDAIHTMTPAGIGCNTAMQDAHLLVKYFRDYGVNVDAIAQYERAMREHGREGIQISLDASKRSFGLPDPKEMREVLC